MPVSLQQTVLGMKRTITFCLLGLLTLSTYGQSGPSPLADSLKQQLRIATEAEDRYPLLIQLSGLLAAIQPDSAYRFAQEAYDLAKEAGTEWRIGEALLHMAPYHLQRGQFGESDSLLALAQPIFATCTDLQLLSSYYHTVGLNAQYQRFYSEASQAYLKSLELQEPFAEPRELIPDYVNVGSLIARRGRLEAGMQYMKQAYGLAKQEGFPLVQVEYNIAQAYMEGNDWIDSAWHYGQLMLASARRESSTFGEVKSYELLPGIATKAGFLDSALVYARKGVEMASQMGSPRAEYTHRLNLVQVLNEMGQGEEALEEFDAAQTLGQFENRQDLLYSQIMQRLGRYQEANEHYLVFWDRFDSVQKAEDILQINEFERIYNTEKKDREIKQLAQANQIAALRVGRQKLIMGLGALFFLAAFALGGVFYQRNQRRQEQAMYTTEQRMLRSQMNPHFIFNALSAVQNYIVYQKPEQASRFLSKFGKLIRQTLENSREEFITLAEEIEMLENYLSVQQLRFDDKFTYSIEVDNELTPEATKLPPMFSQPFIENSLEHGLFKKENNHIWVRFRPEDGMLTLEVEDTGTGLHQGQLKEEHHQSLATAITHERLSVFRRLFRKSFGMEITNQTNEAEEVTGALVRLQVPVQYAE
ncbi:MAG TPA: hypothetical protein DCE41_28315 [Cytophagales bacterium]|nr:hypothetical protein [Cytophagales bacterium]